MCDDCKRREEEAKRPKLPPLKFRVGASSSPPSISDAINGEKRKSVDDGASPTARKFKHVSVPHPTEVGHGTPAAVPNTGNQPSVEQSVQQRLFPQTDGAQELVQAAPAPPSPERRSQPFMNGIFGSDVPLRPPFSPSKNVNGVGLPPMNYQPKFPLSQAPPQPVQQANYTAPPTPHAHLNRASFNSSRPSSSHSTQSHSFPSPIQNRPPMSPTQGNRDVGPLAGFPSPVRPNGTVPSMSFGQQQTPRPSSASFPPSSGHSRHPSFSAATPSAGNSFSHTPPPPGSQGIHLSGLSPTKNSPRPMTSGGMGTASILPPIQRLEPSPKLMGRSSPDAPIPPPVKCMTPEQEERRQRENEMIAQAQAQAPTFSGQQMGGVNGQ